MIKMHNRITLYLLAFGTAMLTAEEWEWLNPLPQGNTLSMIRIRPESGELMAVGGAGTVMVSSNGGEDWNVLRYAGDTRANLYGMHVLDNTTVFACGAWGTVLRSDDGGVNWTQYKTPVEVNLFSIWFRDADYGITVGDGGNPFRTTDGGQTWTAFSLETDVVLEDICFLDNNKGYIAGYGGSLFRTTDGGENWSSVETPTSNDLWAIDFCDASNGLIVGRMGTALRTTDGGFTWQAYYIGVDYEFWDVDLITPSLGYAVGNRGSAYRTEDGGQSWIQTDPGTDINLRSVCFLDENTGLAAGLLGTIVKTTDGGTSWSSKTDGFRHAFLDIAFTSESEGFAVGESGMILHTNNGGLEWSPQSSGVDIWLMSVDFTSPMTGFVVGALGTLLKTVNAGDTWTSLNSGTTTWLNDVFFIDENTGIVTADNGLILKTVNGGEGWAEKTSGTTNHLLKVCFPSPGTGYIAGYGGTILKTTDGGESWNTLNANVLADLHCVYFLSDDIGFVGGNGGTLFKTVNGGLDWIQQDTRTSETLLDIFFVDDNAGYITASRGLVLRTGNAGEEWIPEKWIEYHLWSGCMTSAQVGYVAGSGGVILRFQRPAVTLTQPVLALPYTGSSMWPDPVRMQWNAVDDVSFYHLQVAGDEAFTDIIFEEDDIQALYKDVDLEYNEVYFWRVRVTVDGIVFGPWSDVWTFRTKLAPPVLFYPADNAQNVLLTVSLRWNAVAGASQYHLIVALDANFIDKVSDIYTSETSFSPENLEFGTEYLWCVAGVAESTGEGAWPANRRFVTIAYPDQIDISKVYNFPAYPDPGDYKATDYWIFGLPGSSNLPLGDLLGGTPGNDWNVVWDNGNDNDYWRTYDGSGIFNCVQGRAFWLVHRGPFTVDEKVKTASLNTAREAEIELHNGWNLITNPFPFSRSWEVIKAANGITNPLWLFNGTFQESSTLEAYRGYYFFNASNSARLNVPFLSTTGKTGTDPDMAGWRMTLSLTAPEGRQSSAWIGVAEDADAGLDRFEYRKPRTFGAVPSVHFERPEWDASCPVFANDVRPPFRDLEEWVFTVTAVDREPLELYFLELDNVPEEFEVYLVNRKTNRAYDIRSEETVRFWSAEGEVPFLLLVGTAEAMAERVSEFLPDGFLLGRNYPNPFNGMTTIPVYVPSPSGIELTVYNLLGELVATVYSGTAETGLNSITWDSRNGEGVSLPSGVYCYRLKATTGKETFVKTRKLVLIK